MSANVLDMIINDTTVSEGVWWENGKQGGVDGTSRIALAKRINGNETPEEIIQMLGWEWKPMFSQLFNRETDSAVDAYQIYRNDTMESLGIILSETGIKLPPSPRNLVEWIGQARVKLDGKWSTAGMTTNAKLWSQIALNEKVDLGDGDMVENRLLLSYNYKSRKGQVKCSITNVVCENTLQCALSEKLNGRVDYSFENLDDTDINRLGKKLNIASMRFDETVAKYQDLQQRAVSLQDSKEIATFAYVLDNAGMLDRIVESDDSRSMVEDLLKGHNYRRTMEMGSVGKNILASIVGGIGQDLESRKDNWYGAFQGVTYYVDHVAGRSEDSRVESGYFGQRSELKSAALECALRISEVTR